MRSLRAPLFHVWQVWRRETATTPQLHPPYIVYKTCCDSRPVAMLESFVARSLVVGFAASNMHASGARPDDDDDHDRATAAR